MSIKNSNYTIGNRTRNLPACSAVRQTTYMWTGEGGGNYIKMGFEEMCGIVSCGVDSCLRIGKLFGCFEYANDRWSISCSMAFYRFSPLVCCYQLRLTLYLSVLPSSFAVEDDICGSNCVGLQTVQMDDSLLSKITVAMCSCA